MVHYIYKFLLFYLLMKFLWTKSSRNALSEIKKRMIEQHEKGDINRFKLKFTKKKEFLAVPVPYFKYPAFQLYLNENLQNTYVLKKDKWQTLV